MFEKKVLHIYCYIIGLFFIISGIGKVLDTTAFSALIYQYGFESLMILSPLIILSEILIGLFLVLLINPRKSAYYSLILLIVFTISFAIAHFKNGVNDCGCLGTIKHSNISPVFSFLRNLILILMSLIVLIKYPKEKLPFEKWKKFVILISMSIFIFIAGFTFNLPPSFKKDAEKPKFENQSINNTELTNYLKPSADSTYLVFCFSYTCPHCWNSIENLRQFIKMKIVDSVIVYATGKEKDKQFFYQNFKPDFVINDITHDNMIKLTNVYPTAFYIKQDTIKAVIQGVLPSPITFRKMYLETKFQQN